MNTKKLLFYLLAAILGGCLPVMSLQPLYTEKNLTYNEKLVGTWADANDNTWQFSKADKPEKAYELIFTDKEGKKGMFVAHLVKLDSRFFLDVYPSEPPWDETDPNKVEWLYNTFFFIPVHTFIKVNGIEPQLKLQLTDDMEFKKLFDKDPNAIELIAAEDKIVLTASTEKLQAFVLKYADDSRLFTEESALTRKKTDGSQKSAEKKSKNSDPNKN